LHRFQIQTARKILNFTPLEGFQVHIVITSKITTVFWNMAACSLVVMNQLIRVILFRLFIYGFYFIKLSVLLALALGLLFTDDLENI